MCKCLCKGKTTDVYPTELWKLSQLFSVILEQVLLCAFVTGLPTPIKQLLCASSCMETMALNQILSRASVIMKDKTWQMNWLAAAMQPVYKDGELCHTVNWPGKITCFRCDGQNHLARDYLIMLQDKTINRGTSAYIDNIKCIRKCWVGVESQEYSKLHWNHGNAIPKIPHVIT